MHLSALDYLAAGGAAIVAGAVNALAGGGTLISFPTLIAIGIPSVAANVTNTVSLLPGYFSGTWAQRQDLRPQLRGAGRLGLVAILGGLGGSILLVTTPNKDFRLAVPYLILLSCVLLLVQDPLGDRLRTRLPLTRTTAVPPGASEDGVTGEPIAEYTPWPLTHLLVVFAAAVYGGFFGAGLGILLLAILALRSSESLVHVNALKQALSLVINLVAAIFFAFSGHVRWPLVPVMAAGAVVGGTVGGRVVQFVPSKALRRVVVAAGVGVAISFWVG